MKTFSNKDQLRLEELAKKCDNWCNSQSFTVSRMRNFIENMEELKELFKRYIEFEDSLSIHTGKPVIDKMGKVSLVATIYRHLNKETQEWYWNEVGLVDVHRKENKVKIEEVAPYSTTAEVLFAKKE